MFLRLFDVNFDGFIDKKEFRWMTTSELVSWKTIDLVFEVRTILLRWELFSLDFTDERLFEKAWEGNAFRAHIDLR